MSDYFGALLRSAGAAPPDAVAPGVPPIGQADLVEQEVEVEVGAPPESAPAAHSPDAPAANEPASDTPTEARLAPDRREVVRSEPAGSLVTRPALDEVHPVVRAALEWVAADPEPVERAVSAVSDVPAAQPVGASSPRRQLPHSPTPFAPPAAPAAPLAAALTEPRRTVQPPHVPPVLRIQHEAEPAPQLQAPSSPPSPVREPDLALPRASRAWQPVVTPTHEPAPAPQDRIEVNIGTIHVRVDAPPVPRAVVQPAPPPQRPPQPARPADRSSFSRSRIPRV
jgi:hypothetical protein